MAKRKGKRTNPWKNAFIRYPLSPYENGILSNAIPNPKEIYFATPDDDICIKWIPDGQCGFKPGYYCYINMELRGYVISCIDHAGYDGIIKHGKFLVRIRRFHSAWDAVTIAMHPYCPRTGTILVKRVKTFSTPRLENTPACTLARNGISLA